MGDRSINTGSLSKRGETWVVPPIALQYCGFPGGSDGSNTAREVFGNGRSVGSASIDIWKADSDRRLVGDGSVNTGKASGRGYDARDM